LFASERGLWAVKVSLLALLATALVQIFIVLLSGSVALLADTIHNFGDGLTAIPLWIAFKVSTFKPNRRFTYGYGRVEDLAGLAILLMILVSAVIAGYESVRAFLNPRPVEHLWAVAAAALIGFAGNEAVALFRMKIGREIGSAALVADGYHARVDGLTSLAVLFGAAGVWLGFPLADPLVGALISVMILKILWDSGKSVFRRLLDGVDPEVVDEIHHSAGHLQGIREVTGVRVRWLGHRLHAELNLAVDPQISVSEGHALATQAYAQLMRHLNYLSSATIHIDPANASGDEYHNPEAGHSTQAGGDHPRPEK
jgi:cation diffusion facilitator family transporter